MKKEKGIAGKENRSFAGNIPYTQARTDTINKKLRQMVNEMTHPHTCSEIAEYCVMSKQAVYQIEKRAMRKIAKYHPELKEELEELTILSI